MTHEELILSPEYIIAKIQIDLYNQVKQYMVENHINQTQLAEKLGVSKGYISQVLNGDYDHRISKMVNLALAVGSVPNINFSTAESYKLKEALSREDVSTQEIDVCREFLHKKGYITCQLNLDLLKKGENNSDNIAA